MADFILLMHGDAAAETSFADWDAYITGLNKAGVMKGGSAIGPGASMRKSGAAAPLSDDIVGYLRLVADDLPHARTMVAGNPVYEAGGTVEIRELPATG